MSTATMTRVCALDGCEVSLEGKPAGAKYCTRPHQLAARKGTEKAADPAPAKAAKAVKGTVVELPNVDQLRIGVLRTIPIGHIHPSPDNPRSDLGDLDGLVASITANGILQPPIVVAEGDEYQLVSGHRRRAAGELAGLTEMDCIVRSMTGAARLETMLIENLQRLDLSPVDEANGYNQLVELGLTQPEISDRVGVSQATVSRRLALLELPKPALDSIRAGTLDLNLAGNLARLAAIDVNAASNLCKPGQTVSVHAVQYAMERHKIKQKAGELDEKAKNGKLLYLGRCKDRWNLPKGAVKLDDYSLQHVKDHKLLPCHAVVLVADSHSAALVHVCAKPKSHKKETAQAEEPTAEEAAAQEAEQRREQVIIDRRAFLADLARKPPPGTAEYITTIITQALPVAYTDVASILPYTDFEPEASRRPWEPRTEADLEYCQWLAGDKNRPAQTMFAIGLSLGELAMDVLADDAGNPEALAQRRESTPALAGVLDTHLAFLADCGWTQPDEAAAPTGGLRRRTKPGFQTQKRPRSSPRGPRGEAGPEKGTTA